jgi:hypothetical protein
LILRTTGPKNPDTIVKKRIILWKDLNVNFWFSEKSSRKATPKSPRKRGLGKKVPLVENVKITQLKAKREAKPIKKTLALSK